MEEVEELQCCSSIHKVDKGIHHFLHHNSCVLVIFAVFVALLPGLHQNTFRKEQDVSGKLLLLEHRNLKILRKTQFCLSPNTDKSITRGKNLYPLTDKALVLLAAKIYPKVLKFSGQLKSWLSLNITFKKKGEVVERNWRY